MPQPKRFLQASLFAALCALIPLGAHAAAPVPGADNPAQARVSYKDHRLVTVDVKNATDLMHLEQLGVGLACVPAPGRQKYVLPPDALGVLEDLNFNFIVEANDVQALIDEEARLNEAAKNERGAAFHTAYHTLAEMDQFINDTIALNPAIASRTTIGTSLEGRPIWAVRIAGPNAAANKSFAVICGIHAREWVSPATGLWSIDKLITEYGTVQSTTDLVNNVNWYFVPVMNPDGYQFTITTDRLWRKNRRNNGTSIGVDLNRNFSVGWSAPEGGNSTTPSSETYRGPSAFSEPESQVVRDWVNTLPNLGAFMDIHSFSQLVLAPQGYTLALPARQPEFEFITPDITNAINNTNGFTYVGGPTATTIYIAAGTTSDWAYGAKNIYGYGIECRDTGTFGFQLPPDQIIGNASEIFNGLAVLANYLNVKFKIAVPSPATIVSTSQSTSVNVTAVAFNGTTPAANGLRLFTRFGNAGPFTQSALAGTIPNVAANLPPTPCGSELQYYVEVESSDGTIVRSPANAPASVYSATPQEIIDIASDDFEAADAGWQTNIDVTDTATTGRWERADPQLTNYQPADDHTPGTGVNCWITDARSGTNDGTYDIDGGKTSLYSETFNLAATPNARLGYWRWFDKSGGATNTQDNFIVSVSNGGAWVEVENVPFAESQGGWFYKEIRVADFVTPSSTVRVRFVATDAGAGNIVEAAIDDLGVRSIEPCTPPPSCTGDLNGDNSVNVADLTIFLGLFGSSVTPGAPGDFNSDGSVNVSDLTTFLGRFGATCP
ncbi:MAG: M14 family zinc carboxypeptidase [Phycisphaerales bacterium]